MIGIIDRQQLNLQAISAWNPPAGVLARSALDRAGDGVSCRLGDASCAAAHAAGLSRSASRALHRSLLKLQRDYGNRFVGQVLRAAGGPQHEDDMDTIERSIDGARGGGHGLDHRTRGQMESAFGADFSGVRVHADSRADTLNEALSARAFATGKDIFFRRGEYDPGSSSGRELLAHELTHVVQQNGDLVRAKLTVSQPGDEHEEEADRMAREVIQREHRGAAEVQRQPEASPDDEEKRKLHASRDAGHLARQADEEEQQP